MCTFPLNNMIRQSFFFFAKVYTPKHFLHYAISDVLNMYNLDGLNYPVSFSKIVMQTSLMFHVHVFGMD